jgi:broad specificity phosphatase PhoE
MPILRRLFGVLTVLMFAASLAAAPASASPDVTITFVRHGESEGNASGEQIVVLPGLREIEAGDFEGQPEKGAIDGYFQPLQQWLQGNRSARIPGSIDGNEFDARFDDAVDTIYRGGHQRPVAYSHGGAIAVWTMMNVHNPPLDLVAEQPLPNTGHVVVRGNPQDGWTLLDWNGTKFD